jgi:hypothetical protein
MLDEPPPESTQQAESPPAATLNIDLATMQAKPLVQLQHLLDLTAISMLGIERVDETSYASFRRFFMVSPASELRLSRDAAASGATEWFLRTAFRDGIEAVGAFLEECRIVSALCSSGEPLTVGVYERVTDDEAKKFHRLGLPAKVSHLREKYRITSSLGEHVLSVNAVRNCLVHRAGVTSIQDMTEGVLILRWRAFQLFSEKDGQTVVFDGTNVGFENAPVMFRTVDQQKTFALGERITLSYEELVNSFTTVMMFVMEVSEGVGKLLAQVAKGSSA